MRCLAACPLLEELHLGCCTISESDHFLYALSSAKRPSDLLPNLDTIHFSRNKNFTPEAIIEFLSPRNRVQTESPIVDSLALPRLGGSITFSGVLGEHIRKMRQVSFAQSTQWYVN